MEDKRCGVKDKKRVRRRRTVVVLMGIAGF